MKKSKDGYYRASLMYEGKQYRVTGKTPDEALEKKAELKIRLQRGERELAINGSMTVEQWSKVWLETYLKPKVREAGADKSGGTMTQKSYDMYRQKLDGYILPAIGRVRMKDITDVHLQRVLNGMNGKSKSSAGKVRMVIRAMFRQATISRIIPYDPSLALTLPATTQGKRRSLTDAERALLLKTCAIHRCGLWVKLLLATGIRPGESAPLTVGDFDLERKRLSITKDIESGTYSVSSPKTSAGIRQVPIPDDLIDELKAAFADRDPEALAFPQTDGKAMKSVTCLQNDWRSFSRAMDILGGAKTTWRGKILTAAQDGYKAAARGRILTEDRDGENGSTLAPDLVLYCLRHTYCTDLQKAGVDLNTARQLMGHAQISTTAEIYTHVNDETIDAAAKMINTYKASKTPPAQPPSQ